MAVIKTVCGMCGGDNCGIDVRVEDGRAVGITGMREHPVNRGLTCPQARAAIEMTHDAGRLSHPLLRRGEGWQRIAWDDALDIIAERLSALKAAEGPQALAVYQGRALLQYLSHGWTQRFLNLYGSPNLARNDHMCSYPSLVAERLTYGAATVYGFEPEEVNCLLLWGSNPATSHAPFIWRDVQAARRRGCPVIVIDPRFTRPAAQADLYAPIRPGTDLALALGLIHLIIADGLYDAEFVARWTVGFDSLAQSASAYPPARVAEITGVAEDTIRAIARLYGRARPAHLDAGNALEHHSNSGQTLRAVMILRAITGNLDVPGGHVLSTQLPLADVSLDELRPPGLRPLGAERYPVFVNYAGFVPGGTLVDAILEHEPYPVRAMVLGGGNPALTWPNSKRVRAALDRLDFVVVMDLYLTATAQHADLVLPAAGPLERTQLIARPGPYGTERPGWHLMLRRPAVAAGERRSDWWFWSELGRRMGYGAYYPWADDLEAIEHLLRPLGIGVADLEANPAGLFYGEPPIPRCYERLGFATRTGKFELFSPVLAEAGYAPVPVYREPGESPLSTPELLGDYPLILDVGRRVAVYTHSRHRNLPSLRKAEPEPLAEIHPATAGDYGIGEGETVEVSTLRGRIRLKARLTQHIRPDTVSLLHGWEQANANLLTDDAGCDPIVACPPLRSGLCKIARIQG